MGHLRAAVDGALWAVHVGGGEREVRGQNRQRKWEEQLECAKGDSGEKLAEV